MTQDDEPEMPQDDEEIPPEENNDLKSYNGKRLIQYPFSLVKKDNIEGWYLDWGKKPGTIYVIKVPIPSNNINDIRVGDYISDRALNAMPYWRVTWVDEGTGRVYVDPVGNNPFLTGVGAGGAKLNNHDYEVYSGEYEKKRMDQILDDIRKGHISDYRDVAYLLKGTVPVQMGPNGAQGGWYSPRDLYNNRGGKQGLDEKEIMISDAKALQKLGFPVPPKALDGTMEGEVWKQMVNGQILHSEPNAEHALFPGENWKDLQTSANFVLHSPLPQVKLRNLEAIANAVNPFPQKEHREAIMADDEAKQKQLEADYEAGKYKNPKALEMLHELSKEIYKLEHPTQKRTGHDPYYLMKEKIINIAQKYGWNDILELYENEKLAWVQKNADSFLDRRRFDFNIFFAFNFDRAIRR